MNKSDTTEGTVKSWGDFPGGETAFIAFMRGIINIFPFYILIIDEDHNILLANEAILTTVGLKQDDIVGRFCPEVIHCSEGPFEGCPLEEALKEDRYIEKDLLDPFYKSWVSSSIYPMDYRTAQGKRIFFHVAQDITERKNAENNLAEQKVFLEQVLESLTEPFYVIDVEDYTIKMANSASGLKDLDDTTTCYCRTHGTTSPCDGESHQCPIKLIKKTKKPVVVEHIHSLDGEAFRYYEVHGYPIFNDEGVVKQIIEYTHDITERKEAENNLGKALHDLEENSRVLEEHNITLKVLLNHQEDEKKTIYQNMLESMKTLVFPYVEKLGESGLSENQQEILATLKTNISEIFTPHSSYLKSDSLNLSPSEVRVAMMIRDGKTAKEIANVLIISANTVKAHFRNIRAKLNIKNKKINLRSHLQSLLKE